MGWHADGYRVSIATDNDFHWTNDMLGRPTPEKSFRTSFDDWWNAQSSEFRSRVDDLAAWTGFKRDTLASQKGRAPLHLPSGPLPFTVWAGERNRARKTAIMETDARAALKGWRTSPRGWVLEKLA